MDTIRTTLPVVTIKKEDWLETLEGVRLRRQHIKFKENEVKVGGSDGMFYLFGLRYQNQEAHFTITPGNTGLWTYFHLTTHNDHIYYKLTVNGEKQIKAKRTNKTMFDKTKRRTPRKHGHVSKKTNNVETFHQLKYGHLTRDINLIMDNLVLEDWVHGEA